MSRRYVYRVCVHDADAGHTWIGARHYQSPTAAAYYAQRLSTADPSRTYRVERSEPVVFGDDGSWGGVYRNGVGSGRAAHDDRA